MRLTRQRLNRTLLLRQHLLERVGIEPPDLVRHLVGLQAQDPLPPYVSLAARLVDLDPYAVSHGLRDKSLARIVVMRGTIHLLTADDALCLREFSQPALERERKVSQNVRPVLHLDRDEFRARVGEVLVEPMPMKRLGEALAAGFPDLPPQALAHLARIEAPLVQVPPRGCWKESGGVVLALADRWLGRPTTAPDVADLVRRYLRAFGPATAADVTAWSGVTGLAGLVKGMADLVRHEDEAGKVLYDVADAPLADEDAAAPVRLLGAYDNVWLSHAARDRVTTPEGRKMWMGSNGGIGNTLFVDGWLTGIWRVENGRPVISTLLRELTPSEKQQLDDELGRVEALLVR